MQWCLDNHGYNSTHSFEKWKLLQDIENLICGAEKSISEPDKGISLLSREGNIPLPDFYESMHW